MPKKTTRYKVMHQGAKYDIELPSTLDLSHNSDFKMVDVERAREELRATQMKMNAAPKKLPPDTNNPHQWIAVDPSKSKEAALLELHRTQERLSQGLQPEADDAIGEALEETREKIAKQRDLKGKTPTEARQILAKTQALLGEESRLKTAEAAKPKKKATKK